MDTHLNHHSPDDGAAFLAAGNLSFRQRLDRVEKLLDLLKELPVDEPSPDLAKRTLQFVETVDSHLGMNMPPPGGLSDMPPVA